MFVQADGCNAGRWTTEMATEVNSLQNDIVMLMYNSMKLSVAKPFNVSSG